MQSLCDSWATCVCFCKDDLWQQFVVMLLNSEINFVDHEQNYSENSEEIFWQLG